MKDKFQARKTILELNQNGDLKGIKQYCKAGDFKRLREAK